MVFGEMMMGDKAAKAVPSLAVVEKRQAPRPMGGCVGIFFQLFDWHRRFTKKKLFSRKLLPPVRPKQVMKNFKRDEKMPVAKLHYIADENKGGFPNSRENKNFGVEKKHEIGTPGVVARLMGLESMPSVHRDKVNDMLSYKNRCEKASKSAVINKGSGREEMSLEKGQTRHERPQKLQKTGLSERRAVTRFGAEALQIKGVLPRPKKQNGPKLASPVKSLRISSSRNGSHKSRLIGAATKILEPGLQAKSVGKCALTYSASRHCDSGDGVVVESSVMEQIPYINCGHLVNKTNMCQYREDQGMELSPGASSSSGFSNASYRDSIRDKMTPLVPAVDKGKMFCKRRQEEFVYLKNGKRHTSDCQEPWHLPSKKSASQRGESSPVATLKSKRVSSAARSVSTTKDFVALNRILSGQTRPRVLSNESSRIDALRRSPGQGDDSISPLRSPIRRMRTASSNESIRRTNLHNSAKGKQGKITSVAVTGKGKTSDESSVISFTFNSPLKQNISSTEAEDRILSKSCTVHDSDVLGITASEGSNNRTDFRGNLAARGDALGAILEQKSKELMSQEDDDSTSESIKPKRSTAMILQELIVALTALPTVPRDCDMLDNNKAFQVKSRKEGLLNELPCDTDHFSPGSVLDASFLNDSCVSSSLDDCSGLNLLMDFVDFSWGLPRQLEPDGDLLDSATTREKGSTHQDIMINVIGCISRVLSRLNLADIGLSGSKLSYAKQVILHSEMLFSGTTCHGWVGTEDTIISPSLLDELESVAICAWMNTGWFDGIVDLKKGKQLKEFLFDCLLECLESKYRPCCNFGYRRWTRLPSHLNEKILVRDVEGGLKTWAALCGMSVDEMIEWEMSHSLGKWVDFDIEAFENGCDIEKDILRGMMEEIVDDILQGS